MAPAGAQTTPSPTAAPRTVIDAERAFAADAQKIGQWAAFRKWAAADAVMFVPQPANAQTWLLDRAEPAHAVEWSPTASYQSCDGKVAVNTGEWRRANGTVGYFTTVWQRQADGSWRWLVDSGDQLTAARARVAEPTVRRAACNVMRFTHTPDPAGVHSGLSPDRSLVWMWAPHADGGRELAVTLWDGTRFVEVLRDEIAATP